MQYFATVTGNKDYCAEKYGEAEATVHTMVLMQELQNGTVKLWRNGRSNSITITGKE
jgi:hypothetical protein